MSDIPTRGPSSRGRGGYRGGRGGYRGGRGGKSHTDLPHDDASIAKEVSMEDEGEVGELKAKYADKLPLMREVCEGWSDEDLVFALQETNGDEVSAMDRITSGATSKWGEVKKKQPKAKESGVEGSTRGRGRGAFESRGRGRGVPERGARGASRGTRTVSTAQPNGSTTMDAVTETISAPGIPATNGTSAVAGTGDWTTDAGKDKLESLQTSKPKPAPMAAPTSKSGAWASLFSKPVPTPALVSNGEPLNAKHEQEEKAIEHEEEGSIPVPTTEHKLEHERSNEPGAHQIELDEQKLPTPPPIEPIQVEDAPTDLPSAPHSDVAPSDMLPPSADVLTEKNLNKLPDASNPVASQTVASTVASTQDPLNPALPHQTPLRPGMSGHAASALRATQGLGRASSYSRKIMEQQEAVVMPGHAAVDRAAVQFGKMGIDAEDVDDDDREEPETRIQMPDDSPSAPRTSLPPAATEAKAEASQPAQPEAVEAAVEAPTQREHPGLPSSIQQSAQDPSPPQQTSYPDQYRHQQGQKPYDPFTQQSHYGQQYSEPFSNQLPGSQGHMGQEQAYQAYYGRDYQSYLDHTGQQQAQRGNSAFGSQAQDSQAHYASGSARGYGQQEQVGSGNNTPQPHTATGHHGQHSGHNQHGYQGHNAYGYGGSYGGYGGNYSSYPQYAASYGSMGSGIGQQGMTQQQAHRYGANRPMFDDARRQEDQYSANQYSYGQNQGYGNNYGKSSMHAGPQYSGYSQHEYSSSPGTNSFGGRDGYGRTGSTQPQEAAQSGSGSFGGLSTQDPYGRTSSGFGGGQHGAAEDPAKPTGPSPSLQSQRPGSTAQSMSSQQQGSSLPHPSQQQQAFGGYPQYSGFGNQQGGQHQQQSSYGAYGGSNAFSGYGSYQGRGGWSGQYAGQGQH